MNQVSKSHFETVINSLIELRTLIDFGQKKGPQITLKDNLWAPGG